MLDQILNAPCSAETKEYAKSILQTQESCIAFLASWGGFASFTDLVKKTEAFAKANKIWELLAELPIAREHAFAHGRREIITSYHAIMYISIYAGNDIKEIIKERDWAEITA